MTAARPKVPAERLEAAPFEGEEEEAEDEADLAAEAEELPLLLLALED